MKVVIIKGKRDRDKGKVYGVIVAKNLNHAMAAFLIAKAKTFPDNRDPFRAGIMEAEEMDLMDAGMILSRIPLLEEVHYNFQ